MAMKVLSALATVINLQISAAEINWAAIKKRLAGAEKWGNGEVE